MHMFFLSNRDIRGPVHKTLQTPVPKKFFFPLVLGEDVKRTLDPDTECLFQSANRRECLLIKP